MDGSKNGGNTSAAAASSFGRNNGGGRAPLTGHNLRPDPRKTVRYSDAGKSVESKIGEKTRKVTSDAKVQTNSSSGLAVLEGEFEVPYTLDTGADRSVISQGVLKRLRKANVFVRTKLSDPITLVLGDNSEVQVNELILLNVEFKTKRSQLMLKDIEFRVIPGDADEILIGKSEIKRLQLPSMEAMLDDVAVKLEHDKAAAGRAKKLPGKDADISKEPVNAPAVEDPTKKDAKLKLSLPAGELQCRDGEIAKLVSLPLKPTEVRQEKKTEIGISKEQREEWIRKHKERVIRIQRQEASPPGIEEQYPQEKGANLLPKIKGEVDEALGENEAEVEDASTASWNLAVHLATGGAGEMKEQRENARMIREKHEMKARREMNNLGAVHGGYASQRRKTDAVNHCPR